MWSEDAVPYALALGTIVTEPDEGDRSAWNITVEHSYAGTLSSPFRLSAAGQCNYAYDKFVVGQRLLLMAFNPPSSADEVSDMGSFIWLLDGDGTITYAFQAREDGRTVRTVNEVLSLLGLPDTALPRIGDEPAFDATTTLGWWLLFVAFGMRAVAAFAGERGDEPQALKRRSPTFGRR